MKRVRSFLSLLLLMVFSGFFQPAGYTRIFFPGSHLLSLEGGGRVSVKCQIKVVRYSAEMLRKGCWGVESEDPQSVISEIILRVGNRKIVAPPSSYLDLADPQWAKLTRTNQSYRLVIEGSDAVEAYSVTLDFDSVSVKRRVVKGGASTGHASEVTVYHTGSDVYGP